MFYHSYAMYIISYGLLVYGSAGKTNIDLIEKAQRRILRAIFFNKFAESLFTVLTKNQILAASELYISELIHEVFLQLRGNPPLSNLTHANNPCTYETRRKQHGLLLVIL